MIGKLEKATRHHITKAGHEVIKLIFMLNQLSMKIIMLVNLKMPTTVDILTFICMINKKCESLNARKIIISQDFSFIGSCNSMPS